MISERKLYWKVKHCLDIGDEYKLVTLRSGYVGERAIIQKLLKGK